LLATELAAGGYDAAEADCGARALEMLERDDYDVLLLDLNMPGMGGMDVLKKVKALDLPAEVIILTANATVPTAVEAMKLGAYDYLIKPFPTEELRVVIEKALEKKRLIGENLLLRTQLRRRSAPAVIVTRSPLMLQALETAHKAAASDLPVLVCGESGTGKELIAGAIHDASPRAGGPFVPINCGAIPEAMLESEIFGYEKGAFTGAVAKKPGLLEVADRGTLFLDEIGELPRQLQVKLLRVVETGRFFRLGGTREVRVDIKYVSATNKDLKKEIGTGGFRPDLYYRISALTITVPPLRERPEDIPPLVEHFVKGSPAFRNKTFTGEAMRALCAYPWPGNVRELQNMIHRAALLAKGDVIGRSDLS
ncbi:MAG: sigma-54 dependent transcriptional regulator, partial [Elusimicrobiota bacterium]